jgi:hypothetical protein
LKQEFDYVRYGTEDFRYYVCCRVDFDNASKLNRNKLNYQAACGELRRSRQIVEGAMRLATRIFVITIIVAGLYLLVRNSVVYKSLIAAGSAFFAKAYGALTKGEQ